MSDSSLETRPDRLTAAAARVLLDANQLSSAELVAACLERVQFRDAAVGAWAHRNPNAAMAAARAADVERHRLLASGATVPPLHGIPIGIKDIIDTADYPTENGTAIFAGRRPQIDAAVVAQLRAAGAIVMGKTVTTELAFFGPGKTKNPHDASRTPGGSSSGSAAAVADFQVPLALGTQTAGSIIRPASYCGVIGYKPTFGYASRTGVLAQSAPLDTIGGYARTIVDVALLIDAMSAYDVADRDMTCGVKPSLAAALTDGTRRAPRLAFVKSPAWPHAEPDAQLALQAYASSFGALAEVVETPLAAEFDGSLKLQQIIQFSDIARNYGPLADTHPHAVSQKLKDIIAEGRSFSAADYAAAMAAREPLYDALRPILINYDAIITPAAPGVALSGLTATGSPMFNALWTYLGMPCVSLPLLQLNGLPLGVQVVGARNDDANVLRTAQWLTCDR